MTESEGKREGGLSRNDGGTGLRARKGLQTEERGREKKDVKLTVGRPT